MWSKSIPFPTPESLLSFALTATHTPFSVNFSSNFSKAWNNKTSLLCYTIQTLQSFYSTLCLSWNHNKWYLNAIVGVFIYYRYIFPLKLLNNFSHRQCLVFITWNRPRKVFISVFIWQLWTCWKEWDLKMNKRNHHLPLEGK